MTFAAKGFLALFLFASCVTALRAQTIEIRLVDGKTGRPITNHYFLNRHSSLNISAGQEPDKLHLVIPTDKRGVALLRFTHNDSEINVPECKGRQADWQKLQSNQNEKDKEEFNKKYKYCTYFEVGNPVVRYADSFSIMAPSFMYGNRQRYAYIPCWVDADKYKTSWLGTADFSTKDVLEHGVVAANTCGKAIASPQAGQLILFVRLPSNGEYWRQAWN